MATQLIPFTVPPMPYSALVIGRRATGKTTLVADLLAKSGAAQYTAIVPHNETNELYEQKIISTDPTEYLHTLLAAPIQYHVAVLDGCMISADYWQSDVFRTVIAQKHPIIITASYTPAITLNVVSDIDYMFLFREQSLHTREQTYHRYAMPFMSRIQFDCYMDTLKPYECIVLDTKARTVALYCASHMDE
jgi:hypothetical protein